MTREAIEVTRQENIFKYRDIIMWKLKHNEPLEEIELQNIENALTMDCLRSEVLLQSLGGHKNTFKLSTARARMTEPQESEG